MDKVSASRTRVPLLFCLSTLPVLVAIWALQWFVTTDGPSHLYNAHIMLEELKGSSGFEASYTVNWSPLPNVSGHYLLMLFLLVSTPRRADQLMMTLTLVGFAASSLWLRWRVAGRDGLALAVPLSVLLALNWLWLLGFYNFLLGAMMFNLTLGAWWTMRDRMGWRQAAVLSACLVAGYLCHLVSFGLTLFGLASLTVLTPGHGWRRRALWTLASFVPLAPLVFSYHRLMKSHGQLKPYFGDLKIGSPASWLSYMRQSDLLTVTINGVKSLPFVEPTSKWFIMLAPANLLVAALAVLALGTAVVSLRSPRESPLRARLGWLAMMFVLLAGWAFGPIHLGAAHGSFLRERLLLVALAASVPLWDYTRRRATWLGVALLVAALCAQTAFVWEYALDSHRLVGRMMEARPFIGTQRRVLSQDVYSTRFRASSMLHAPSLFGIGTGNVMWNNYEAASYVFPVKFRRPLANCDAEILRRAARLDRKSKDYREYVRINSWQCTVMRNRERIDVLLMWEARTPQAGGAGETSIELNEAAAALAPPSEFQPVFEQDGLRVYQRR